MGVLTTAPVSFVVSPHSSAAHQLTGSMLLNGIQVALNLRAESPVDLDFGIMSSEQYAQMPFATALKHWRGPSVQTFETFTGFGSWVLLISNPTPYPVAVRGTIGIGTA